MTNDHDLKVAMKVKVYQFEDEVVRYFVWTRVFDIKYCV